MDRVTGLTEPNQLRSHSVARPSDRGRRAFIWLDLLVIGIALAAMVAANTEWLLTKKEWIDTWMYFGYFRHYGFPDFLADNKKIARLPWILLGYLLNRVASPLASEYILHLGLFAAGLFGVYCLTLRMFGRAVAVIVTLAYLTYLPAHANGGWDYHNTLAGPLYIFAYASLLTLLDGTPHPVRRGFVFGSLFALTLHTNIIFILLVPSLIFRTAVELRSSRRGGPVLGWFMRGLAGAVTGAVSVTLALGLINVAFGRRFLFFMPLADRSVYLLGNAEAEKGWWLPWSDSWWYAQIHTTIPDVLIIVGLFVFAAMLFRGLRRPSATRTFQRYRFVLLEFLLGLLMFAIGQTLGQPLLEPWYMAFPLVIPGFLALGSIIAAILRAGSDQPMRWNVGLTAGAAAAFIALFLTQESVGSLIFPEYMHGWDNSEPVTVTLVALGLAYAITRLPVGNPIVRRLLILSGSFVLVLGLAHANARWPQGPYLWKAYDYSSDCTARKAAVSAIVAADDTLFPRFTAGRDFEIVYKDGEVLGPSECPLNSYDVGQPLLAMGYGSPVHYWNMSKLLGLPDERFTQVFSGISFLAVLTNDKAYVTHLLDRLRKTDPYWHDAGEQTLDRGNYALKMQLLSSEPDPATWHKAAFSVAPENGAVLRTTAIDIKLASAPDTRSARLTPEAPVLRPGSAITLALRVHAGEAAVGILSADNSRFIQRKVVAARNAAQIITLQVPASDNPGPIVVDSTSGGGDLSILAIHDEESSTAVPFAFMPENDGSVSVQSLDTTLPKAAWGYATQLKVPAANGTAAGVAINLRVVHGEAGIGLLKADGSDFVQRTIVPEGKQDRSIIFHVPDWSTMGPLVIQSIGGGGEVAVSSVNLFPPAQ